MVDESDASDYDALVLPGGVANPFCEGEHEAQSRSVGAEAS